LLSSILVGFDGSENSYKALDFSLDLAEKYHAQVLIVNVFQPPAISNVSDEPLLYSGNAEAFIGDLRKIHRETLTKAVDKAKTLKPNLVISSELSEGEPAVQIVSMADEGRFSLIVIGHKSESRIREILLGGTCEKVAHLAHCPVLIVK
jgi:nucleotide-binding universal stress UspA family protein